MNDTRHTVLCVDDEINILQALKRLLRKEPFDLLTASGGAEGLQLLKEHDVQLVISDQRMPDMSGTEFLAQVKAEHPDIIRIILTGFTDVDSITDAINKGHIYKFFLKPWNDQNLTLEIRQALHQYDLEQANKCLNQQIREQNETLKALNNDLENIVRERTRDLEIQNRALELSHAVLEDLPVPIIGISVEGLIVMVNQAALAIGRSGSHIQIGTQISSYVEKEVEERITHVLATGSETRMKNCRLLDQTADLHIKPLLGRYKGKGAVVLVPSV